jgi:hypothetical protein
MEASTHAWKHIGVERNIWNVDEDQVSEQYRMVHSEKLGDTDRSPIIVSEVKYRNMAKMG